MRHRKQRSKLGMKTSHRKAALRSIVKSLLKYQRIEISLARAKVARRLAERLITLSKSDTVKARRDAYVVLADRDEVGKLFKEIAPLFKNRMSGYTRIIPLGFRRGDGASMCILELTERKIVEKLLRKKKKEKEEPKTAAAPTSHAKEEHKKEAKKIEDEKMSERAKAETKKVADKRGFMKNLRGLFRKRGDF